MPSICCHVTRIPDPGYEASRVPKGSLSAPRGKASVHTQFPSGKLIDNFLLVCTFVLKDVKAKEINQSADITFAAFGKNDGIHKMDFDASGLDRKRLRIVG
eukprot:CAMPEP_0194257288 /NCGR_PEP_ID=MMETSP0158-20130606/38643_1 /TAXON_ID=33649 /ORGANISM="Thalassionema nitzschioides, Strain L26-B" /LENGTH=100 /DNA_ID=CAMNT_0038996285 /DNA_START=168 /DNA_END=470 /DNA_ORIENTATION=-